MASGEPTILVVEDEPSVAAFVSRVCRALNLRVQIFSMLAELERVDQVADDDIVLLDLGLHDSNGIDVLRWLAERRCAAPSVLMSGQDDRLLHTVQRLGRSFGLNVVGILQKPFTLADLRKMLQSAPAAAASRKPERTSLAEELYRGIVGGELTLHYQPKLRLSPELVVGCEALVRWQHPERGLLPPAEFLTLAERDGLMGSLTHRVMSEALDQLAAWRRDGVDLNVAVNVPVDLLQELSLPDTIQQLLARDGLDGSCLTIEVTEAAVMKGLIRAVDVLARLRLMGITLSIDDFGTGYSSIVKLRQLPFNELKIDRSFIQDMRRDPEARALIETMLEMGRSLGMTTVAEGVESAADAAELADLGCDVAQGYYFTRPLPPDELGRWLRDRLAAQASV